MICDLLPSLQGVLNDALELQPFAERRKDGWGRASL